jgi:hypothetical protein
MVIGSISGLVPAARIEALGPGLASCPEGPWQAPRAMERGSRAAAMAAGRAEGATGIGPLEGPGGELEPTTILKG